MPWTGQAALDPNAEVDLLIDPAGDRLQIDPAGDVLEVTPIVTWIGETASETV